MQDNHPYRRCYIIREGEVNCNIGGEKVKNCDHERQKILMWAWLWLEVPHSYLPSWISYTNRITWDICLCLPCEWLFTIQPKEPHFRQYMWSVESTACGLLRGQYCLNCRFNRQMKPALKIAFHYALISYGVVMLLKHYFSFHVWPHLRSSVSAQCIFMCIRIT